MVFARSNRLSALIIPLVITALAACGGSAKTATATPTTGVARVQTTQAVPSATTTTPGTPTPLANGLPTVTARATTAATANTGTPTSLARTTATVGASVTAITVTSGTATRVTQVAGSAVTGTGVAGTPTTTPVPTSEARGVTEQFLRTVLAKGDISGYLTPSLKSQAGNDGYALLTIQPPVREFTIDSEQRDADGNGATVGATITTASGVAKRTFVLRKQGGTWLIDSIRS